MDALGDLEMISFSKELEHIHNYVWLEKCDLKKTWSLPSLLKLKILLFPFFRCSRFKSGHQHWSKTPQG